MATRIQLTRIERRISALASLFASPAPSLDDPRVELARRIDAIASRLRDAAEERGEPWPPPHSPEAFENVKARFRTLMQLRAGTHA